MKTAWTLLLCLCLVLSMTGGLAEAIRIDQPDHRYAVKHTAFRKRRRADPSPAAMCDQLSSCVE